MTKYTIVIRIEPDKYCGINSLEDAMNAVDEALKDYKLDNAAKISITGHSNSNIKILVDNDE